MLYGVRDYVKSRAASGPLRFQPIDATHYMGTMAPSDSPMARALKDSARIHDLGEVDEPQWKPRSR